MESQQENEDLHSRMPFYPGQWKENSIFYQIERKTPEDLWMFIYQTKTQSNFKYQILSKEMTSAIKTISQVMSVHYYKVLRPVAPAITNFLTDLLSRLCGSFFPHEWNFSLTPQFCQSSSNPLDAYKVNITCKLRQFEVIQQEENSENTSNLVQGTKKSAISRNFPNTYVLRSSSSRFHNGHDFMKKIIEDCVKQIYGYGINWRVEDEHDEKETLQKILNFAHFNNLNSKKLSGILETISRKRQSREEEVMNNPTVPHLTKMSYSEPVKPSSSHKSISEDRRVPANISVKSTGFTSYVASTPPKIKRLSAEDLEPDYLHHPRYTKPVCYLNRGLPSSSSSSLDDCNSRRPSIETAIEKNVERLPMQSHDIDNKDEEISDDEIQFVGIFSKTEAEAQSSPDHNDNTIQASQTPEQPTNEDIEQKEQNTYREVSPSPFENMSREKEEQFCQAVCAIFDSYPTPSNGSITGAAHEDILKDSTIDSAGEFSSNGREKLVSNARKELVDKTQVIKPTTSSSTWDEEDEVTEEIERTSSVDLFSIEEEEDETSSAQDSANNQKREECPSLAVSTSCSKPQPLFINTFTVVWNSHEHQKFTSEREDQKSKSIIECTPEQSPILPPEMKTNDLLVMKASVQNKEDNIFGKTRVQSNQNNTDSSISVLSSKEFVESGEEITKREKETFGKDAENCQRKKNICLEMRKSSMNKEQRNDQLNLFEIPVIENRRPSSPQTKLVPFPYKGRPRWWWDISSNKNSETIRTTLFGKRNGDLRSNEFEKAVATVVNDFDVNFEQIHNELPSEVSKRFASTNPLDEVPFEVVREFLTENFRLLFLINRIDGFLLPKDWRSYDNSILINPDEFNHKLVTDRKLFEPDEPFGDAEVQKSLRRASRRLMADLARTVFSVKENVETKTLHYFYNENLDIPEGAPFQELQKSYKKNCNILMH